MGQFIKGGTMNKQIVMKAGSIAGLVVSLVTGGVTGYRILAAPAAHAEDLPKLPTPTEAVSQDAQESVETVYDDVFVTPTPKPTISPAASPMPGSVKHASGPTGMQGTSPVVSGRDEDEFEDEEEDHIEFEKEEGHETPEPTHTPEPRETPEPTESAQH